MAVLCFEQDASLNVVACRIEVDSFQAADVFNDVVEEVKTASAYVGEVARAQCEDC